MANSAPHDPAQELPHLRELRDAVLDVLKDLRLWHNAGLPNQAREPPRGDSVRRVGLPGVATGRACDD